MPRRNAVRHFLRRFLQNPSWCDCLITKKYGFALCKAIWKKKPILNLLYLRRHPVPYTLKSNTLRVCAFYDTPSAPTHFHLKRRFVSTVCAVSPALTCTLTRHRKRRISQMYRPALRAVIVPLWAFFPQRCRPAVHQPLHLPSTAPAAQYLPLQFFRCARPAF